jgi:hypothetical protein
MLAVPVPGAPFQVDQQPEALADNVSAARGDSDAGSGLC